MNDPVQQANHHHELPIDHQDPVLRVLHFILRMVAYVLSIAMVIVILIGVASVFHEIIINLTLPPFLLIPDIIKTFGAFLAVLIAYEIFMNITVYIRSDVFPMKLVIATAIMAVARKVIVLDMHEYSGPHLTGLAAIIIGLAIAYWLTAVAERPQAAAAAAQNTASDDH